jgi:hypothetical protein
MRDDEAARVIDTAIDVLHEKGWNQGESVGPDGSVCLGQALYVAGRRLFSSPEEVLASAREAVRAAIEGPSSASLPERARIASFNDDSHTTFEDVLLVLKHAREAVSA